MGNTNPQSSKAPIKTPFKCPKLQFFDFDIDIDDEDCLDKKWWVQLEEHFKSAGTRLLGLKGHVGHPPAKMPCSTLWKGAQLVDDHLEFLTEYVQGTLYDDVQ